MAGGARFNGKVLHPGKGECGERVAGIETAIERTGDGPDAGGVEEPFSAGGDGLGKGVKMRRTCGVESGDAIESALDRLRGASGFQNRRIDLSQIFE